MKITPEQAREALDTDMSTGNDTGAGDDINH